MVVGLLFTWGDPLDLKDISAVLEMSEKEVEPIIKELIDELDYNRNGLRIIKFNNLYQIGTRPEHYDWIKKLNNRKNAKNLSPELLKKEEAKLFLSHTENTDLVILLDENGKQFTSREFAGKIDNWMNSSVKKVSFFIGGAYGFSDEIYQRANEKMSLSKMTFTHQMIRLFFVEQIYRADQILQGKPYHND
ncbi:MAG: 23S rRNA (pseudouridine(1915)-N(3))-methyltransferase RlmH [Kaistella sp.]|nr:23S rRNA (pseudouridine(1915)-N(3))-methyltransferase RlmH [Kaistella sp.]